MVPRNQEQYVTFRAGSQDAAQRSLQKFDGACASMNCLMA
jgi:hypothetical protein